MHAKSFLFIDNPEDHSHKDFFVQANPNSIRTLSFEVDVDELTRLCMDARVAASSSYVI